MAFFPKNPKWESQNWNFWCLETLDIHIFLITIFLDHTKVIFYSPKKNLSNGVWHIPIGDHLTPAFRKFVVMSQIPNLIIDISFDHNSCISYLNEQCEGTLDIYTSRPFQWDLGGSIWCSFSFSTKALNIQDSRINATPKVGMHLGIIGFHFLHSPSFVKVCFTSEHTLVASWALAFHLVANQMLEFVIIQSY